MSLPLGGRRFHPDMDARPTFTEGNTLSTQHSTSDVVRYRSAIVSLAFIASAMTLLATRAHAQAFTPISGNIFDGSGGPLLANTVYVATGSVIVPAGQTLTIPAGAAIKFSAGAGLTVGGTLNVTGTGAAPVRFTSSSDDSVGGDTNNNGPSNGAPGQWAGINAAVSATVSMTQASVRFAGGGFAPAFSVNGATVTLSNVSIANALHVGLHLNGGGSAVTVANSAFTNNGNWAVTGAALDQIPTFSGNTATGNGFNAIQVVSGTLAANRIIAPANCMGGALVVAGTMTVPAARSLTLQAGTILKMAPSSAVNVDGALVTNGTTAAPVVFTSLTDDAVAGDTNNNGPSSGTPGQWVGVNLSTNASASSLTGLVVRYSGGSLTAGISLSGCNPTLSSCRVESSYSNGIDLSGTSFPTITGCTITSCGGTAIHGVALGAVSGLSNNTATGNTGNYVRITTNTLPASRVITPANCLNGALVAATNLAIPAGVALTLAAGTCIKFQPGSAFQCFGTLLVNGSSGSPAILTSIQDDSAFGDTNNNGPSTGAQGRWSGVTFLPTSAASVVHGLEIRFAGGTGLAALDLQAANITLDGCRVVSAAYDGINLNATGLSPTSGATITGCQIVGCGGTAINNASIDACASLNGNIASGCGFNAVRVTNGTVAATALTLDPANGISGAILVNGTLTVPTGKTLTLHAGTVVKLGSASSVQVSGTLMSQGTGAAPVCFTSYRDDSVGGDTNGNGPTVGQSGDWRGLVLGAGASASLITETTVRFTGYGLEPCVAFDGSNPTLYASTFRDGYSAGLKFTNPNSRPQVVECHITDNGGYAVDEVPVDALPGIANTYASGNHSDTIRVVAGTASTDLVIGPQAGMAITFFTSFVVPAGRSVDILPGTVIKFRDWSQSVTVDGSLDIRGTGYEPVVFTSHDDDTFGGDSEGGGPTTGIAGQWSGIVYHAGAAASSIENVIVRNCGGGLVDGLSIQSPQVSARAVRVERSFAGGIGATALAGAGVNWVARACASHGIRLSAGTFDVAHATVTGCHVGLAGNGWSGSVRNSIVWGNVTNLDSVPGNRVFHSDGAYPGVNGNIDSDPQFLAASLGNLHLDATSPCIGTADFAVASVVAKDWDEQSRMIDSTLGGTASPEMGAFERPIWFMTVTGAPRPGATLTFNVINGVPGTSVYVLGALDGEFPISTFGMALVGLSPIALAVLPTGTPLAITIPQNPALLGFAAGIQTLTVTASNPTLGSTTNLYRAIIRP